MALPTWLLGRHVTALTATGQTAAADGLLTLATGAGIQSLLGQWEEVNIDYAPVTEEISAADALRTNNVKIKSNNTYELSAILRNQVPNGAPVNTKANPLAHLVNSFDYMRLVFTRGAATGEQTYTFDGLVGNYREAVVAGKCMCRLTLIQIDNNTANPTYA